MAMSSPLRPFASLLLGVSLAFLLPSTASAAFMRFAHPQADDTIRAFEEVPIVAVSIGDDLPADIVLEASEDGETFWELDFEVHGRVIAAFYVPTFAQGDIVIFRTRSASDAQFNFIFQCFVEP